MLAGACGPLSRVDAEAVHLPARFCVSSDPISVLWDDGAHCLELLSTLSKN
jgi:hypothetical protein